MVIIWTISNWTLFSPFPRSMGRCLIKSFFSFQLHICKQIFNTFSTNLHPISLQLNLSPIAKLNWIELKLKFHSTYLNSIQLHMNCISSQFKWTLQCRSSLVVHNSTEPKRICVECPWLIYETTKPLGDLSSESRLHKRSNLEHLEWNR